MAQTGAVWRGCFWCGGVFCRLWGDSIEKREENPLQSFTEEKNPQAMGMVESSGARPAPQGVRDGRSNLHQSRKEMCPLLLLKKTRMAWHRWELWDGGKGPWAAVCLASLTSALQAGISQAPNDVLGSSFWLMSS